MKRLFFFLLLIIGLSVLLDAGTALAAPFAERIPFTQPDGTQITLWGQGDEFYAVFETLDGYTVIFIPTTKTYDYAKLTADGNAFISTGLAVGLGDPATLGVAKHLRISQAARSRQAQDRFQKWDQQMKVTARWKQLKAARQPATLPASAGFVMAPPSFTTTGTKVGLTLLIDFPDDTNTISKDNIVDFCNSDSYTGYGNNGSVKKYFFDNSNGRLTYTNVVTIYIRMTQPKTYYNNTAVDCGTQGRLLINDAIAIMQALPTYTQDILPTYNALTVDGSGNAVAFNVFFAGGDSGVWSYGLWPHSWSLATPVDLGNGTKVSNYQITNIGTSLELGTFCHENGHMLCGYPDIYDYDYDSKGGAGIFCLMNSGGHGNNPVQICAYLKRASGWATTIDLTSTSNLVASVSSSGSDFNKFYRYQKPGVPTEYYLIENRQTSGRDSSLPGGGILIWHIDELGNGDNQSITYNTSHSNYEVSLMQADNLWHFQNNVNTGDSQDLYYHGNPASGYANAFSDVMAPSARWWDGTVSGVHFSQFSASGSNMTFFVGNDVNEPTGFLETPVSDSRIDLSWGKNPSNDNVMVAWNTTAVFGTPSGTFSAGTSISGGGTVLYNGSATTFSHTELTAGTKYYYKAWSVLSGSSYSMGVDGSATTAYTVPFTEGFEHAGSIPNGWSQEYVTHYASWTFQNGGYYDDYWHDGLYPPSAHGGSYHAYLYFGDYGDHKTKLVTPMIDFGVNTQNAQLTFWHFMQIWGPDQDELRVYYKTSAAGTWTLVATYTNDVSAWTQRTLSLPNPNSTYYIGFEGNAMYGWGVGIDDIVVMGEPVTTSHGTPIAWLQLYGLTNFNSEAEDILDGDGDGKLAWEEYVCDTIPTNRDSVLSLLGVTPRTNGVEVQWKGGIVSTQYLERTSNLYPTGTPWTGLFTNIPPTSITNTWLDPVGTNALRFYRMRVVRPN